MDHLENNRDVFEPYVEDDESFDDYLGRMRGEAEWGGNQELVAASQLYKVRRSRRNEKICTFMRGTNARLWLSALRSVLLQPSVRFELCFLHLPLCGFFGSGVNSHTRLVALVNGLPLGALRMSLFFLTPWAWR